MVMDDRDGRPPSMIDGSADETPLTSSPTPATATDTTTATSTSLSAFQSTSSSTPMTTPYHSHSSLADSPNLLLQQQQHQRQQQQHQHAQHSHQQQQQAQATGLDSEIDNGLGSAEIDEDHLVRLLQQYYSHNQDTHDLGIITEQTWELLGLDLPGPTQPTHDLAFSQPMVADNSRSVGYEEPPTHPSPPAQHASQSSFPSGFAHPIQDGALILEATAYARPQVLGRVPPPNPAQTLATNNINDIRFQTVDLRQGAMQMFPPQPQSSPSSPPSPPPLMGSIRQTSTRLMMVAGALKGAVVRFDLHVIQQPIQGRTFNEKDRRSIIPAPIILLDVAKSIPMVSKAVDALSGVLPDLDDDTKWEEHPLDLNDFDVSGIVCTADVIHYSGSNSREFYRIANTISDDIGRSESPLASHSSTHEVLTPTSTTMEAFIQAQISSQIPDSSGTARSSVSNSLESPRTPHRHAVESSTSVSPIEAAPKTRNLYGNASVGGRKMFGMNDDKLGIWFVFSDISVKRPGEYALRFRCYDLSQMTTTNITPSTASNASSGPSRPQKRSPVLAECFSECFTVYSARSYPPPPPVSRLTEHFTR